MAATYSELHQKIQDKFNEGGVEILSPHYRQIRDGSRAAIPNEYLPADYEAPPLRISRVEEPVGAGERGAQRVGEPEGPERDS